MNKIYPSMEQLDLSLPQKEETARELGILLNKDYNGHMTARDAGRIGGVIGGNKVKEMIRMAQEALAIDNPDK